MIKRSLIIIFMFLIVGFTIGCTKQAKINTQNSKIDYSKDKSLEDKPLGHNLDNGVPILSKFDESEIENSLQSLHSKFNLLSYFPCNFSNEYDEEYIAFYNDPSYIISDSAPLGIYKVIVVFIGKNKSNKIIDLNLHTLGYDKRNLATILKDSKEYGKWNGYCYLTDTDGDGLDELYFYELSGMSFGLVIMKYSNNDFVMQDYIDYMNK